MKSSPDPPLWLPLDFGDRGGARAPSFRGPAGELALPEFTDERAPHSLASRPTRREVTILAGEIGDAGDAYEQGYADGKREGEEETREEMKAALAALRHATQALHAQRQEIPRAMGSDLHALAVAIAAKIVEHEIASDSSFVKGLITRALDLLPIDSPIEIRLHPIDMGPVRDEIERIGEEEGTRRSIQWETDPAIARGGFVAEGPHRILDGRLDVALRMILERLESE